MPASATDLRVPTPRKPYHHMNASVARNVVIRIGNDDGLP